MRPSTAWLLLLACAFVQGAAIFAGLRAGLLVAAVTAVVHFALVVLLAMPAADALALGVSFWVAAGAILLAHRRMQRERDMLATLCNVDEATGCLNRRGFSELLDRAVVTSASAGAPVSLLALDLDHFKQINDRFGHLSGDAVLCEVVSRLTETVGQGGVVARLGGEEFAVLLPGADAESAGVMAERVLGTVRGMRLAALPPDVRLTMSAGIAAESVHEPRSAGALRARADEALYAAKRTGRDRALLWAPGVRSHATPATIGHSIRFTPRSASLH